MRLVAVDNFESLKPNGWGIPEPIKKENEQSAFENTGLDLLLCPGLGFDINGGRIGRGKGYYDTFLSKGKSWCKEQGSTFPITIGVAFDVQQVAEIPMSETDFRLDHVWLSESKKDESYS
eukprot:TRINITY_DN12025_c0_g1_i3.p2 TRINITY_DN12025_c0_g1~~TRINITY_DN12025_c0_g1_i3.p2  ORF type:complete len:120 (-),score=30.50 TRINITY_DN12025_c0_g1_i3:21-380(-)